MLPRWLLTAGLLCSAASLTAQPSPPGVFDLARDREPMMLLDGSWRFHAGDNPQWADPAFDDSHWSVIQGTKGWSVQGYPGLSGFGWYRATLLIPAGAPPLALYVPSADRFSGAGIFTAYQAFGDGKPLDGCGRPAAANPIFEGNAVCYFGHSQSTAARTVVLAIRVWHWPHWANYVGGGVLGGLRIGGEKQIEQWAALKVDETAWNNVISELLAILYALAGLSALGFFLLRPREKEYLWFGVVALLYSATVCLDTYALFHTIGVIALDGIGKAIEVLFDLSWIAFYFYLLRGRRTWLFWVAVASVTATALSAVIGLSGWISVATWQEIDTLLAIPLPVWILSLLIIRAVQGFPDARLLLAPALLQPVVQLTGSALWVAYVVGWYRVRPSWYYDSFHWPFPFTIGDLADFIFLIAMLAILILRFNRTSAHQERLTAELEAARAVQQILVPEEIPPISGFSIRSVYKPASEVGGDFFQILPASSGGVLIVLGDVSGKGMPAAMVVSLLVGTARTLSHYTDQPGKMLEAMNQRMIGRAQGGFTTCLILRVDQQGNVTAANAGHLAPYIAGREVPLENGLPLGIDPDATYEETAFTLNETDQLTLITDGVVEARNRLGELLGFDRLEQLGLEPAETIAETARAFGQNDDITVLTLKRLHSTDEHSMVMVNAELATG